MLQQENGQDSFGHKDVHLEVADWATYHNQGWKTIAIQFQGSRARIQAGNVQGIREGSDVFTEIHNQ
jgi:hypothetical protein